MTLLVDDVQVGRKFKGKVTDKKEILYEFQFRVSDGDAELPCTLSVYHSEPPGSGIVRVQLTVDGQPLYEGA